MSEQIAASVLTATFDAAILQNAGLNVDVALAMAVGGSARVVVRAITIVSEENLAWDVLFWGKSTHGASYDGDTYIGHWSFAAVEAITYTGDTLTAYRYFIPDLDLPYQDLDAVNANRQPQLHITLVPRGAAHVIHKNIAITFYVSPETAWAS